MPYCFTKKWISRSFPALFLAFLLLSSLASSASDALIWKIQHPRLPGTLYLAGSVHSGNKEMYPLDGIYDQVLEKADYLIFEIAEPNKLLAMQFVIQKGLYSAVAQENLRTTLGESDFQRLEKTVPSLPSRSLERMKPWTISSVWEVFQAEKLGFYADYGMENVFHANRGNRPERSLENDREQLECISSPDLESELIAELKRNLNHPEKIREAIQSVIPALREGNTENLLRDLRETKRNAPVFYRKLIVDRNRAMAEKLLVMMEKKETGLALVGVAHYLGTDSIITFLKRSGCTSTRLKLTGKAGKLSPRDIPANNDADKNRARSNQ